MKTIVMPHREIYPGVMRGEIIVPPSKSISHRLLIIAALSGSKCRVRNVLWSDDIQITLQGLQQLGFDAAFTAGDVVFSGRRTPLTGRQTILLGNSGTSARLLTACAAILPGHYLLDGTERLQKRPMQPLLDALLQLGADIEHHGGNLPLTTRGRDLEGCSIEIDASLSSQFISALLLIAPLTRRGITLVPHGPVSSRPYVDLTISLMRQTGIDIRVQTDHIHIPGNQTYQISDTTVEGDYSSASYFAAGAALSGGEVLFHNLAQHSAQGDRMILDILGQSGAHLQWNEGKVVVRAADLQGIDLEMNRVPDLVPTVANLALFSRGTSRLRNIAHLRHKESDRLTSLVENIGRLGGRARVEGDDLVITPTVLRGATLSSYDDHRIAMSFALAGLRVAGIRIENPQCVEKSFPDYWQHFDRLVERAPAGSTVLP